MLDLSKVAYNEDYRVYFTYDDIKHLPEYPEGPLIELYNGDLFMVPSPNFKHQKISFNLTILIGSFIENNNLGTLIVAPFDVILSMKNVFVPDLIFVSKENNYIISDKNIAGTPDFIIEILSSNKSNDLVKKKQIYESFGVKEYWIIDPIEEIILKYLLKDEKYELTGRFDATTEFIEITTLSTEIPIAKIFKN